MLTLSAEKRALKANLQRRISAESASRQQRRAVSVVHLHVTVVSDEYRQLVSPIAQARVVEPVDPHERGKSREATRATPEAGWGDFWRHFENLPTLIAAKGHALLEMPSRAREG